ncbi:hypothetical protein L9F63_000366, partial [Diploptera punctata]
PSEFIRSRKQKNASYVSRQGKARDSPLSHISKGIPAIQWQHKKNVSGLYRTILHTKSFRLYRGSGLLSCLKDLAQRQFVPMNSNSRKTS